MTSYLILCLSKMIQGLFHSLLLIKRKAFFKFCIRCDTRGFPPSFLTLWNAKTLYLKKPYNSKYGVQNYNRVISSLLSILLPHQDSVCQITTSFPKALPISRVGNEWIRPYASVRLLSDKAYRLGEQYWDICVLTICTRCSNAFHTYDTSEA